MLYGCTCYSAISVLLRISVRSVRRAIHVDVRVAPVHCCRRTPLHKGTTPTGRVAYAQRASSTAALCPTAPAALFAMVTSTWRIGMPRSATWRVPTLRMQGRRKQGCRRWTAWTCGPEINLLSPWQPRICSRTLMGGRGTPSVFPRGGGLLPSVYADVRSSDDVVAFVKAHAVGR